MKTTKTQQAQTRARILKSAVDLISHHGYDAVTMKDIAKAAHIGDATIYKYFATKERLVLGYFDQVVEDALRITEATPDFADYDLQSRLQRLTDALLEILAPNRAFVDVARALLLRSPLLMLGDQLQAKQMLKQAVAGYLDAAVARGEMPPTDFARPMAGLYADFCAGVIAHWLHDATPQAGETTRLVDQVLGVLVTALKAGLPDRLVQLAGFLLRSQLARMMDAATQAQHRRSSAAAASQAESDAAHADAGRQAQPAARRRARRNRPAGAA